MDKISISALDKIMHENYTATAELDWHGHKLIVKRTLPLQSMLQFVDSVVKSCFSAETGEYMPEARDFAMMNSIVAFYTDVSRPKDIDHLYLLLYQTDLIPTILDEVNERQFNEMAAAIDSKLRYVSESNAERIAKKMNEIFERVNELANSLEDLLSGVSADDIIKLSTAIADSKLDEDKILKLVTDGHCVSEDGQAHEEVGTQESGE